MTTRPHATRWAWDDHDTWRVIYVGACPRSHLATLARRTAVALQPEVVDWQPLIRDFVVLLRLASGEQVQLGWARPNYSTHNFDPEWVDERELLRRVDGVIFVPMNPPAGTEITLASFEKFRQGYAELRRDYCPLGIHWQGELETSGEDEVVRLLQWPGASKVLGRGYAIADSFAQLMTLVRESRSDG